MAPGISIRSFIGCLNYNQGNKVYRVQYENQNFQMGADSMVGCKLDLRDQEQIADLEQAMSPIMQQFGEIETCIECSALRNIQVHEVFYYSQKAVVHPTAPLFDQELQTLKPRGTRALKRIFILCDYDRDGALNDAELNDFQVRCFNAPLQPSEIDNVKNVVKEQVPEGVNYHGLTLAGFLFLNALFVERGKVETAWTVLLQFLELNNNLIDYSGFSGLASALLKSKTINAMYLNGNYGGVLGAAALAKGLEGNRSLRELYVNGNSVGDEGVRALVSGLVLHKGSEYEF
ncbi:hypothetical protein POM88_049646 [Heracleum sosnowskyi]|uniref:EF hand associated type-2 domain-containing protein n=1 Tax=Heracleum sosnowskyi TaxID=360622 RepID=A0AAD8GW08_9APIA|nr:hypothetical protein POM88_049646 [Heracleum sosnowskyi]